MSWDNFISSANTHTRLFLGAFLPREIIFPVRSLKQRMLMRKVCFMYIIVSKEKSGGVDEQFSSMRRKVVFLSKVFVATEGVFASAFLLFHVN